MGRVVRLRDGSEWRRVRGAPHPASPTSSRFELVTPAGVYTDKPRGTIEWLHGKVILRKL